ncbi:MAG TPA: metallophosphoesterase [Acetobacteraceae bacterium]|nr:metallophosphoesterase [Acetobacteraceae bacterium]
MGRRPHDHDGRHEREPRRGHGEQRHAEEAAPEPRSSVEPSPVGGPVFAQPEPTPDPTRFAVRHGSDREAYREIDILNREHRLAPMPFPAPRGGIEPRLTLAEVLGSDQQTIAAIEATGRLVFHAVGDTGSTRGPETQNLVADKMTADFDEANPADAPRFFFHLGDVIYSFGEAAYYYDQFYEPYRDYPAPVIAIAGNHDGMVAPESGVKTLTAFLENFCQQDFVVTPEAGGLSRTAQIEPGVFFTFEAPFLRVLALYSNTLEDPGVIADDHIGDSQLRYVEAALQRVREESFQGALLIAHHHPVYVADSRHGGSPKMGEQIDEICEKNRVWPHAVLAGHAHNYQRFTRRHAGMEIPYLIAGNGGHGLARLSRRGSVLRTPSVIKAATSGGDDVTLENYDDRDYGYLRVIVTQARLRIEYHPASDGPFAKTPDDVVTVVLASRTLA